MLQKSWVQGDAFFMEKYNIDHDFVFKVGLWLRHHTNLIISARDSSNHIAVLYLPQDVTETGDSDCDHCQ